MEIDLEETWIDLFQDSQDYYLTDHNSQIDPPILPLDEEWQTQHQLVDVPVVETVPEEQNAQPRYFKVELPPPPRMEEVSDSSSSSSDEDSDSEDKATVFAASGQVRCIDSNVYLGINTVSNPKNLVYATLNWEHVRNDSKYQHHHDMFMHFFDAETCKLVDPDGLHPFCLVSKLNADDYLSFKEILCMDKEL